MDSSDENEYYSESESNYELSETSIKKLKITNSLSNSLKELVKNNTKLKIYCLTKKQKIINILENINDYTFNNKLDDSHLKNLKNNFSDESLLLSTFICFKTLNDGSYYLLDGHHRKKIILENDIEKCPETILFHVYEFTCLDDPKIEELFDEINNTKPYNKDIIKMAKRITENIKNYFETHPDKKIKNEIFSSAKTSRKLKINTYDFNTWLQVELSKMTFPIDENKIIEKIKEINFKIKREYVKLLKLMYPKVNGQELKKLKKKVNDLNCYLILKKPSEYLKEIH